MNQEELYKKMNHARAQEETIRKQMDEAEAIDKEVADDPILSLEEVTRQMATGMIQYPEQNIRIRAVSFFDKHLCMPIPVDYLDRHTTEENLAVLVNDALGISLSLQYTVSEKKDVTFEQVKSGTIGQFKAAGVYLELLEEGWVEDENAPLYFMSYRMPMAGKIMYQLMFYAINQLDGTMIIGNYNCFYKDVKVWQNIMKATMSYIDFR